MWLERGWGPDLRTRAIEDGVRHTAIFADASEDAVVSVVRDALDQVTAAFGLLPVGAEGFDAVLRGRRPVGRRSCARLASGDGERRCVG
jgi:hypothetical protein